MLYHVILIILWTAKMPTRMQKQFFLTAQVLNAWCLSCKIIIADLTTDSCSNFSLVQTDDILNKELVTFEALRARSFFFAWFFEHDKFWWIAATLGLEYDNLVCMILRILSLTDDGCQEWSGCFLCHYPGWCSWDQTVCWLYCWKQMRADPSAVESDWVLFGGDGKYMKRSWNW